MGQEEETRKLLNIRDGLEKRIERLQAEIEDLKRAVEGIDGLIVRRGFRKPTPSTVEEGAISIKAKDGTLLGTLQVSEGEVLFTPRGDLAFETSIPPFQSFFIERVLENMRATDEGRASRGEIPPDEILSYEVSTEEGRLVGLSIQNYGGERRLREIRSSLRWTFDKMYEKLRQG
ncbi:MAG: hypothetical protein ACE5OO_06555 [Candidatus Bathyarchaeia archaeon]